MSARSTRGPGGGKIHGRRPPARRGGGRSGSPPTASGQNVGGGWFSCPMAIPVLPVLLLFALLRYAVRNPRLALAAVAGTLAVLSVSVALTPFATPVWAGRSMASWTAHGGFMVALLVAAVVLYLGVSLIGPRPMRRLANGDRIVGNVYVIGTQMDPDYDPPSGSLNPAATVPPAGPRDWGARSSRPGPNSQPVASGLGLTAAGATRASAPAVTYLTPEGTTR